MTINEKQAIELLEAAKSLIKWVNENLHPHCEVVVGPTSARMLEMIKTVTTEEYLRD